MGNKAKAPDRKHNRLQNYDYSSAGAYFITICTKDRQNILSEVVKPTFTALNDTLQHQPVGTDVLGGPLIDQQSAFSASNETSMIDDLPPVYTKLTKFGESAEKYLLQLDEFYKDISVDEYVIMPDHIHIIFIIPYKGPSRTPVPTPQNTALARFISTFKRFTNKECGQNIWQFRSYDHVIRDRRDLETKRKYIYENPTRRYYKDLESK